MGPYSPYSTINAIFDFKKKKTEVDVYIVSGIKLNGYIEEFDLSSEIPSIMLERDGIRSIVLLNVVTTIQKRRVGDNV